MRIFGVLGMFAAIARPLHPSLRNVAPAVPGQDDGSLSDGRWPPREHGRHRDPLGHQLHEVHGLLVRGSAHSTAELSTQNLTV